MFFLFAVNKKTLTFGVEFVPLRGKQRNHIVSLNGKSYVRKEKINRKKEQKFAMSMGNVTSK